MSHHGQLHHRHPGHRHFAHGAHGRVAVVWWISDAARYSYRPQYSYYSYAYPPPAYANVWYYCASVGAYYPYVQVCPEGWVPVTPY